MHLTMLSKIEALHSINKSIIADIESSPDKEKIYYVALPRIVEGVLSIEVQKKKRIVHPYTLIQHADLSYASHLQLIEDIFNDNVVYQCNDFDDCKRLNERMYTVSQKYKLFGGSDDSLAILRLFLSNFEVIQVILGTIQDTLLEDNIDVGLIMDKVEMINQQLGILMDIPGVYPSDEFIPELYHYKTKWSEDHKGHSMVIDETGLVCTLGDGTSQTVRAQDPLPTTGRYYWEVQVTIPGKYHACYHVGVSGEIVDYHMHLKKSDYPSWSFEDEGFVYQSRVKLHLPNFSMGFKSGDQIGILVDMDKRTLCFYVNGVLLGEAFSNLPEVLYPVSSLYNSHSKVTLSFPKFPPHNS